MAPTTQLSEAEAQWRESYSSMKAALAKLRLPAPGALAPDFDGDEDDGDLDESSSNEQGQDVWDFISDDEDELGVYSSDDLDGGVDLGGDEGSSAAPYGLGWLAAKCERIASKNGLVMEVFQAQILDLLGSKQSEEELQSTLADLIGFDDFELIIELLAHKSEITAAAAAAAGPQSLPTHEQGSNRLLSRAQREEALRRQDFAHKTRALATAHAREPEYPHVYKTHNVGGSMLEFEKYEEYFIPAGSKGTLRPGEKLVAISDLDGLCRKTFKGYKSLNRMQSLVYPVAYKTSENMLICAPTGAGKTDAAMLTILQCVGQYVSPTPSEDVQATDFAVDLQDFKIVYVAPMKALAAEVTEKLGKRLAWLGIKCREYTGDMHLTKPEIVSTQIIVTTPEKWDVVTRKGTGDTELVQKVRLLIIDEVHMLHDERGAVLESLVARTQRQVESTQSLIRIVGLSATLPNYVDVADFLRVNKYQGLFYFDASFRPVPLETHFIGVKGPPSHGLCAFSERYLFTAKMLREKAVDDMCVDLFDPSYHPKFDSAMKDVRSSKARDIRELVPQGLGVHHAGMARSDRNLMERLFGEGVLKVLCCTATLAWGVNLPAAAVVIKGTQVYSAQDGKFVDLGILDVLQIFGRAGRPQFEDTGIGMICTTQDKLSHYLTAVTEQRPIESRFSSKLVDNLNAEISLGTVTSIAEAVQWIGYSYLFVRMQRSHQNYGIEWAEIRDDTTLVQRRRTMAIQAARELQKSQMIIFNERTEELRSKDIGRIASQYYILHTTIQIFNTMMKPESTEADILKMISMSGEFDNIQFRESEADELMRLKAREDIVPCAIDTRAGADTPQVKTNILLQTYISRAQPEDFALGNDLNYVAQQSGRICRALFMIALNRRWGHQCLVLLTMAKSIEKRIWPFQHPLHQFDLPKTVLKQLDSRESLTMQDLKDMEPAERLSDYPRRGGDCALNRDVLRIKLFIEPGFSWNDQIHGTSESYYIWVENSETSEIYHHEFFILTRRKLHDEHELNFTIPLSDPLPTQIYVRAVSDRWLGAESVTPVSFQHLIRPDTESVYTDLLNLRPLRFQFFNPMQTQIFHTLYHTPANVLLGSPTGSGKTVAAELAMWWAFKEKPGSKVVYIAPMKALVRERVKDWGDRLAKPLGMKIVELTGDNTPDTRTIQDADVIITTPEKWDGISRSWQTRGYVRKVSLVIIDEIHLLAGDRGPILEIIVSRMNYIAESTNNPVRLLGMSTACANATDLGNWLGVKEGLFNFRHSVRPVPLELYIDGFPEVRGFCPLMQSMNRPTFLAIKNHSPDKPVIVFVPSRRQTRLTAKDLVNYCGMEDNPRRFLNMDEDDLQLNLARVKDDALKEAISFGIGLHHAGLVETDRQLSEELFLNNKIQILVATSTLAWGVNLPAHLVVVKGTQFYDAKIEGYKDMDLTDVLQMLGRAGRPQFDNSGVARIFTQDSKKDFYKHFLHTGFPVESSLHTVLDDHLCAEISAETIVTKQDALDYLTWTFFFRRLHKNPSYYGLEISAEEHNTIEAQKLANDFMIQMVDSSLGELQKSSCIDVHGNGNIDPTPLGKIMSYYYLSHKTIRYFARHAKAGGSFSDVLTWMSRATEYDELPVRHNEDLINAELSRNLPFEGTSFGLPMWDPHVKAFLLLQAYFSRISLPITDYVGDQTSVLDQAIRIVQAGIDVLTEMGHLSSCLAMMQLLQCIKSARQDDSQGHCVPDLERQGEAPRRKVVRAGQVLRAIFQGRVEIARHQSFGGGEPTTSGVTVQLRRLNALMDREARAYAPRYPKPQTEGWFVVLADRVNDEVLAVKRIGWPLGGGTSAEEEADAEVEAAVAVAVGGGSGGGSGTGGGGGGGGGQRNASGPVAKVTMKLRPEDAGRKVEVRVVSDTYVGLEHVIEGIEVPAPPKPSDGANKRWRKVVVGSASVLDRKREGARPT
ncbi:unnamed protein product [Parascedosporium putredinis]|uniref:Activating signal cointegrator 1 complex subunit 3 n=1 Tax=Parascedosporium putredinis TaxID=1442378 RepID=A0A9P1GV22_9PEZI|nr:unnamed protein product [Parascedosporium putredinis]CAI7987653.1 unnamed protein product [Parascedosporium putredinis]